jgi:hypothetical protein
MNTTKTHGWQWDSVTRFVKAAIEANKAAWDLVPSMRAAIIALKYAEIVSGQERETIPSIYLTNLWRDMLEASNLLDA